MTRDETKRIIQIMCATYPNWHPSDLSSTVDAWHLMLEEYPFTKLAVASNAYIRFAT